MMVVLGIIFIVVGIAGAKDSNKPGTFWGWAFLAMFGVAILNVIANN